MFHIVNHRFYDGVAHTVFSIFSIFYFPYFFILLLFVQIGLEIMRFSHFSTETVVVVPSTIYFSW